MWPFGRKPLLFGQYRDLADPGTPFQHAAIIKLLQELRTQHSMVDSTVSNVPHDRFDRIKWDIYYLGPGTRKHNFAGTIHYSKNDEEIATVKLLAAISDDYWTDWSKPVANDTIYPLEFTVSVFGEDPWTVSLRACHSITYEANHIDKSIVYCDLLAGFFDAALNVLGREPLKVTAKEVEWSTPKPGSHREYVNLLKQKGLYDENH